MLFAACDVYLLIILFPPNVQVHDSRSSRNQRLRIYVVCWAPLIFWQLFLCYFHARKYSYIM